MVWLAPDTDLKHHSPDVAKAVDTPKPPSPNKVEETFEETTPKKKPKGKGKKKAATAAANVPAVVPAATKVAANPTATGKPRDRIPIIKELMKRIDTALSPWMQTYLKRVHVDLDIYPVDANKKNTKEPPIGPDGLYTSPRCNKGWSSRPDSFIGGCCMDKCRLYSSLEEAKDLCLKMPGCNGVVASADHQRFELRESDFPDHSPAGETAHFVKLCKKSQSTHEKILEAWFDAVAGAIEDPTLGLKDPMPPTREDGSVFVSVGSYRDPDCAPTIRDAILKAKNPEKIFVGVVQQNCQQGCMKGVGWANTRHLENAPADIDCAKDFCDSPEGKPHCEAGRVRILRLQEWHSLGPFFARYLAAQLYGGENFFLQIDSHTRFRQNWDTIMDEMMHRTRSYPKSVISNYPPSGPGGFGGESSPPDGLCGCSFEGNANKGTLTIRLNNGGTGGPGGGWTSGQHPRYSAFIAAGFYFTHAGFLHELPFDPFLPYLFMGEEIALSSRFWTHGYDIYAPVVNVVSHEYVRKDQSKFWETVGLVFAKDGIHNDLVDLILPRVQHLVGYPERADVDAIEPHFLMRYAEEYGQGKERKLEDYLRIVGLDVSRKTQQPQNWCARSTKQPE